MRGVCQMDKKNIGLVALGLAVIILLSLVGVTTSENSKLNKALESQTERADVLENQNDALEGQVAGLEEQVNEANAALERVSEKVKELGDALSAFDVKNQELEDANADLETENQVLEEQLSALETDKKPKEGYVIDELSFGDDIEGVYDDGEVDRFVDDEVEVDDENYDIVEEFYVGPEVYIATNSMLGEDEEFGRNPYLVVAAKGALAYRVTFEDPLPVGDIDDDEELVFPFLGEELTVVSLDDDGMIVRNGELISLNEGEEVTVEGVVIQFLNGGLDEEAVFLVDGNQIVIDQGQTKKVSGVEILVDELIATHSENDADIVFFYAGKDVEVTYDNGDDLTEDPNFYMNWALNGDDELLYVEVSYEERNEDLDDDYPPLAVGECLEFPLNGPVLCFDEVTDVTYAKIDFEFDDEKAEDDLLVDADGLWLRSDEAIFKVDNEEVKEVFLVRPNSGAWSVYYDNDDNEFTLAGTSLAIEYEDTEYDVLLEPSGNRDLVFAGVRFDVRPADGKFGDLEEEAEDSDIVYFGRDFGLFEEDLLLLNGVIIESPQDSLDNDELTVLIPSDDVEATVLIK